MHYSYTEAVHVRREEPGVYPIIGGVWCGATTRGRALVSGQWDNVTCTTCLKDREKYEPLGMW